MPPDEVMIAEVMIAEVLARRFHEHYESLATTFGYQTRTESRRPWLEVPEQNRQLMIATCECIIADDSGGTPWSAWLDLPLRSAVAVVAGIVKPLPCPTCNGAGRITRGGTMKTSVNYDTALAAKLTRLQDAFYAILEIHWDETHVNPDSAKMKEAIQEFKEANAAVFRFKEAWHEIQEAVNGKE